MENKKLKLDFDVTIFDVVDLNKSFAAAKCEVCYTGRNRNKSDISKQAIEAAIPSIYNIPVVGRYDEEKDDFSGHDVRVISNDKGISIVNATIPFGVVPESAKQWFETKYVNGVEKECFFTDVILWKRQHGYEHIVNAGTLSQSMEINCSDWTLDGNGYCIVNNFEFEALCLLGSTVEPAFENACVQMYSNEIVSDFQLQFSEMLKEFKEFNNNENNDYTKTGGDSKTMDEKMMILEKFNKTVEELDFSIEEMSVEELEQKMAELFGNQEPIVEKPVEEPVVSAEPTVSEPVAEEPTVEPIVETFSATFRQKKEAIENALAPIYVKDAEGHIVEETYFWVRDFDDTYVFVEKSHYTVDTYEYKNGRFSYTFDEASMAATISGEFEEMYQVWLTAEEKAKIESDKQQFETLTEQFNTLQTEFDTYKENYSTENSVVKELSAFKAESEANVVFAKYETAIGETKEFVELKANFANYTVTELEKECIYIRGLYAVTTAEEPVATNSLTFSIDPQNDAEDKPYGGIFEKYLNK